MGPISRYYKVQEKQYRGQLKHKKFVYGGHFCAQWPPSGNNGNCGFELRSGPRVHVKYPHSSALPLAALPRVVRVVPVPSSPECETPAVWLWSCSRVFVWLNHIVGIVVVFELRCCLLVDWEITVTHLHIFSSSKCISLKGL